MNWELFVGLRYLRSRRRRAIPSLIASLSLVGVTIGVATLIIVLAIMTGLEHELRAKILGFNPHVTVLSYAGPLTEWRGTVDRVRAVPGVTGASAIVYGQAMIGVGRNVSGVVVRGIDPATAGDVLDVERHLTGTRLATLGDPRQVPAPADATGDTIELPGLIIGRELARQLGLAPGDIVNVISPLATPTAAGMVPRLKRFVIVDVFESGMFDYDTTLAYMALADAQRFFDLGDEVGGIEVRVADVYAARDVARAIETALDGFPFRGRDWMEANRNLFSVLKLEKVVYAIVLLLIVIVAAFNILAGLSMLVKEKRRDIAVLKSLGASSSAIGRIFVLEGGAIGLAGTLGGTLLGLTGCGLLSHYQFIQLPKDVFLLTTLPVHVEAPTVALVAAVAMTICIIAAISPARRAASLVPVEVIRYE